METIKMTTITILVTLAMTTLLLAQKMNRKELVDRRTKNSKTFINADTTFTKEISLGPVHYLKNDKFEDINENIILSDTEFDYEVTQGSFNAFFQEGLDKDYPIVFEKAGASVGFGPKALVYWDQKKKDYKVIYDADMNPQVQVEDNQIVYKNLYPGVDMQFSYLPNSLRELVRLGENARNALPAPKKYGIKDNDAWLMFLYKIDLGGSMSATVGNEKIGKGKKKKEIETFEPFTFKNIKGEVMFTLTADYAYVDVEDIDITKHSGTTRMYNRIFQDNEDYYLLSGISYKELLKMPKGPIVFDPDYTVPTSDIKDASICSWDQNNPPSTSFNWGGSSRLKVEVTSAYAYRSLMRFELGDIIGSVLSAKLKLYQTKSDYGGGYVNIYKVTRDWNEGNSWGQQNNSSINGVTWWERWLGDNKRNNTPADWESDGGDFDSERLVASTLCNEKYETQEFALDKQTVQEWLDYKSTNYGLILIAKSDIEGGLSYRVWFGSSTHIRANERPEFTVTYKTGPIMEEPTPLAPGTTLYIRGADGNVIATYKSEN